MRTKKTVAMPVSGWLISGSLAVLLAGCASDAWRKPGTMQADLTKDRGACESEVQQSLSRAGKRVWVPNSQNLENRCMAAKGWTLSPRKEG